MPKRNRDTHDVDPVDFVPFDTPDTDDVLDVDPDPFDVRPIPVTVEGEVRVANPGSRTGAVYTVVCPPGRASKLLADDPRRETATIVSADDDVLIGVEPGDVVGNPGAGVWPVQVPLTWRLSTELWAAGSTATATVTVIVEQWAR